LGHPKEDKTIVLVKPDGVKRGLTGEIVRRIEQRGLKIIALDMIWATEKQMDVHYPKDEAWIKRLGEKTMNTYKKYGIDPKKELGTSDKLEIGKMVRSWVIDYMISGPIVKMVVKGIHAIDMCRKIAGNTLPYLADMGTVRGDFSVDSPAAANKDKRSVHNVMHASENKEEAEHELKEWFAPEEVHDYKKAEEDIMF